MQTPIEMHLFAGSYVELTQLFSSPFHYSKGVEKDLGMVCILIGDTLFFPDNSEDQICLSRCSILGAENVFYYTDFLGGMLLDTPSKCTTLQNLYDVKCFHPRAARLLHGPCIVLS